MTEKKRPPSTIPTLARPLVWLFLLAFVSVGTFFLFYESWTTALQERTEFQRRQNLIQIVSVARNSVEPILAQVRAGAMTGKEGLARIRTLVRAMTYEDAYGKNYLFMSAYDGTMLVQPFEPAKELTNQWDLRDDRGVYIIRELVRAARSRPEGSFVSYHYHLPGLHGTQEKLAYVVGLPEVGAYIGTGMYLQRAIHEQRHILEKVRRGAIWLVIAVLVPLSAAVLFIAHRNRLLLMEVETREKAEGALRESEERFRTTVETLPLGVALLNAEGVAEYVNGRFTQMLGYALEDVATPDRWFSLSYPDEGYRRHVQASWQEATARVMATPNAAPVSREYRVRCKDGTTKIIEFNLSMLSDRMLLTFSDVTERRRAEEVLRLQAARVEALLALYQMADLPLREIIDFALEEAVRITGSTLGYLAFLNEDETTLTMHSWSRRGMAECRMSDKPIVYPVAGTGLWGEAVRQRRPIVTNDYAAPSPLKKGYPEGHVEIVRHMNVPVFSGSRIVLVAGVGNKTEAYNEMDVGQLTLLMDGVWSLLERKKTHEELAKTQALLQAAIESSPAGVVVADAPDVRIRMANRAGLLIRGESDAPLTDIPAELHPARWQISRPDGTPYGGEDLPLSRAVLKGERVENELAVIRRGDGEKRWVLASASPIRDEGGEIVGGLVVFPDVTELRQAEAALQESEKKYRDLADLLPQALFETDAAGRLTYANRFGLELFGYSPQDLQRGIHVTDTIVPSERQRALQGTATMMAGQLPQAAVEYTAMKVDGQEFPVVIYASPVIQDGVVAGMRGILIDMTERRRLEHQLLQAQKMEAIGTLAGGIAHDFNNILMGIQGYASLVKMDLSPGDTHYEYLTRIEEQVRGAADLTRQLLGFARGGRYEVRPLDLNEVVDRTSTMFGRTKKELSIHRSLRPDLWTVEADRGQIEQILLNLYLNAWQAMSGGGDLSLETGNVLLTEEQARTHGVRPGKYVRVTVADTGSGMDQKTRDRIFEPFFSTKGLGRGTGLGLAMVYGIVKGHSGFITVDSEENRGSVFTIYLPASEKEAAEEEIDAPAIITGRETILLVDDERAVRDVNAKILKTLGYKVLAAGGGREAVDVLAGGEHKIDLVILDMVMPDMSGEETFYRIKEIDPAIKIILSSGYSLMGQAGKIMEQGCDGFLQKPFDTAQLSREIRRVLGDPEKAL